jgi:hypothetical protein
MMKKWPMEKYFVLIFSFQNELVKLMHELKKSVVVDVNGR